MSFKLLLSAILKNNIKEIFYRSGQRALYDGACMIVKMLQQKSYEAYFVGGAVRDALLGLPVSDIDIATSARPEEVLSLFQGAIPVGASFGVVLVPMGGLKYDVATFRQDGSYSDGRRPDWVSFSTARQDVERRDFTINGLLYDPMAVDNDFLLDYVGGLADITTHTIRTIGDPSKRFREDALRMLRAVRFAVTKGFVMDDATLAALSDHAHLLQSISVERIQDEFDQILESPQRRLGVELLCQTGLMQYVIPEFLLLLGCNQSPDHHPEGDVYTHTLIMLDLLNEGADPPSLELILSVILHDIAKPACQFVDDKGKFRFFGHESMGGEMARTILNRLRYSNETISKVVYLVKNHMRLKNVAEVRNATFKRWVANEYWADELELTRVDCSSSNGNLTNYNQAVQRAKSLGEVFQLPAPFVTGRDLINLGLSPGPEFKSLLERVFNAQLDGQIHSKDEGLSFLDLI